MGLNRECLCGRETVALVERLHQFDVMRANKAPFAWGLEPRVPFLDKAFLDVSMGIDPAEKMVRRFLFGFVSYPMTCYSAVPLQWLVPCRKGCKRRFCMLLYSRSVTERPRVLPWWYFREWWQRRDVLEPILAWASAAVSCQVGLTACAHADRHGGQAGRAAYAHGKVPAAQGLRLA